MTIRFSKSEGSAIHLQDRDLKILAQLGELGLLDTHTIHQQHFAEATLRRCQQRLAQLEVHGLIRTVRLAVWHADQAKGGRVPAIHCVTEDGADAVEAAGLPRPKRISHSEPKPATLRHRLAVVRVRLAIDEACRRCEIGEPEWIMEQDLRHDMATASSPSERRMLYHVFSTGGQRFSCRPDAASLLWVPRNVKQPKLGATPLIGLWEIDQSTEGLKQIKAKLPGYGALVEKQGYGRYWPGLERPVVRIFWVCRTAKRVATIGAAVREDPVAKLFRLTDWRSLDPARLLTEPVWSTVNFELRSVLRGPVGKD